MAEKRHALVIGASSGIGFALAERLVVDHKVSAVARRDERLAALRQHGARGYAADVADLGEISGLIQTIVADQGPINAMIYCAGMQKIKPLRSMSTNDIEQLLTINLAAPLALAGQFASKRVSTDDAVFCAVSSIAAERPEPGIVGYAAAKAGLSSLIKGMARELGPRRAVGVAPGWIDTEMTQAYPHLYNEAFQERLAKETPASPARIEDVVETILYLISPAARSITGEIIRIDGGISL